MIYGKDTNYILKLFEILEANDLLEDLDTLESILSNDNIAYYIVRGERDVALAKLKKINSLCNV